MSSVLEADQSKGTRVTREEVDRAIRTVGRAKEIADIYPVSPLQQGVLFQSFYAAGSAVYLGTFGWRIKGPLDVEAFEGAWNFVIQRHDILRTTFAGLELTTPLQVVLHRAKVPFKRLDWRELPVAEQDMRYHEVFGADRAEPFDFTKPPLMRLTLIRVGEEDFRLLWTLHLLVIDGWSMATLSREVLAAYEALRTNVTPSFGPVCQYRDFVSWLRKQDPGATEKYWLETLAGFLAPTSMGIDEPNLISADRGEARDHWHEFDIDLESIKSFARLHKITVNTLVQGVWALLLSRYSGSKDVVVGVTLSGRPADLAGIEAAVGPYISTLPMRLQVDDEMPAIDWLQSVHRCQIELLKVQHSSLAQVQKYTQVPVGLPLFESNLIFENYPTEAAAPSEQKPHIRVYTESLLERSGIPLSLTFIVDRALKVRLTFDTSRFRPEAMERLAGHLQILLKGVLAEPRIPNCRLPVLGNAERTRLLTEWNDTGADFPRPERIFTAFTQQVLSRPLAIALIHDNVELTYAELNVRANRLAHFLLSSGVGRGTIVGLCIERSPQMVIGLLAILKAGAAYLPIDPAYPRERIRYMLEDCKPPIILTQSEQQSLFQQVDAKLLYLDQHWNEGAHYPEHDPPLEAHADSDLAYVVYTSGSSGRPKGVMGGHCGVVNYLRFLTRRFNLTPDDVMVNISSVSFDASIRDIFGTLSVGARLVIPSHEHARDAAYLAELIESQHVSVLLSIVPSLLDELSRAAAAIEYRSHSPRLILVSGQALLWDSYRNLVQVYGAQTRLINQYGPTETTMTTTVFTVPLEGSLGERILIGRPIANARMFVLDARRQQVPIGVPGELYVGGVGVTHGYLNQPELTAERFVENPFDATQRLYRTGDLVRYREDGNLEYVGRLDNQVKIRGFRVEPGEIEASLLKHADVKHAIVTARQHGLVSEQRLVAYVICDGAKVPSSNELREHLRARVPDFMIPAAFVFIEKIPLTPNGKIDLRALPAPDILTQLQRSYAAPGTPVEEKLAAIWAKALKLERIGIQDNFFEAGGDSILALQVVARSMQAGLRVTLRDVFEQQTIELLAASIELDEQALDSAPVQGSVPLAPAQRRILEANPAFTGNCIRSVILVSNDKLSATAVQLAVTELIRHHYALRLSFLHSGSEWQQRYSAICDQASAAVFEHVDLSKEDPNQREVQLEQVKSRLQRSMDLSHAPLIRVALIECGKQEQRLVVLGHRLIMDDYSWAILVEDLQNALAQSRLGIAIRLPRRSSSPDRWAERLAAFGRCEALRDQGEYWLRQSWERCSVLPRDFTATVDASLARGVLETALNETCTNALLCWLSGLGLPIECAALTAVFESVAQWTGSRVLAIDVENQRREQMFADLELSRTMGCLSWRYPLLLDVGSEFNFGSSVDAVAAAMRSVPFAGLGFGIAQALGMEFPWLQSVGEVSFSYVPLAPKETGVSQLLGACRKQSVDLKSAGSIHHPVSIVGAIIDGCLNLTWSYDAGLFEHATIASLAARAIELLHEQSASGESDASPAFVRDTDSRESEIPLTPIQRMCMADLQDDLAVAIPTIALTLSPDVSPDLLTQALEHVVRQHVALRLSLTGHIQKTVGEECLQRHRLLEFVDVTNLSQADSEACVREAVKKQAASIDLSSPPLIRAVLIRKPAESTLWMGVHHFAIDPPAWQIVQQDLKLAYEQLRCHETVQLPNPVTSFSDWARNLAALAKSPAMLDELQYWRTLPWQRSALLPLDNPSEAFCEQAIAHVTVSLDEGQTTALTENLQRKFGAQIDEVLLTALMCGLRTWTGQSAFAVDLMDHGRRTDHFPDADLSRTVGWFSTRLPVMLELEAQEPLSNLRPLQTQIRTARSHAIGWGVLRYSAGDPLRGFAPVPQIRFNHIGRMDRTSFDSNARTHFDSEVFLRGIASVRLLGILNIMSYTDSGCLHVHFRYDENRHRRATMERVAKAFHEALTTMIATNQR